MSVVKPYDLITDNLVRQALKNEKGAEAEVISWQTKDFTNKGDNYASVVTSIMVKCEQNGEMSETSYVVKINPQRPKSAFTDILEDMYARETFVLREIVGEMNKHLNKLNLDPIKTPKLYARSLEKGKEVFITENLRKQGFRMHDRKMGMDIKHALLVMEELGRFHASSLLYEETLSPKTIPQSFDYFEEPWTDYSHASFSTINALVCVQAQNARDYFKKAASYEKCVKWLTDKIDSMGKLYIETPAPSAPFDTLIHGDCWSNNILFKYDEEGNPVDVRFVDLQACRKSSHASEINYFYYTSLNGEVRQKYTKTMEKTYYNSFSKVLELAGKPNPFSYSEFEIEMMKRKICGLLAGMFVLPAVFAEGDEIWDLDNIQDGNLDEFKNIQNIKFSRTAEREEGPFKDRFLAMFDEMIEYKIFDD